MTRTVKVRRTVAETKNQVEEAADKIAGIKTARTAPTTNDDNGLFYYKKLARIVADLGSVAPEDLDEVYDELKEASDAIAGARATIDDLKAQH
jgi:hypothetical protein